MAATLAQLLARLDQGPGEPTTQYISPDDVKFIVTELHARSQVRATRLSDGKVGKPGHIYVAKDHPLHDPPIWAEYALADDWDDHGLITTRPAVTVSLTPGGAPVIQPLPTLINPYGPFTLRYSHNTGTGAIESIILGPLPGGAVPPQTAAQTYAVAGATVYVVSDGERFRWSKLQVKTGQLLTMTDPAGTLYGFEVDELEGGPGGHIERPGELALIATDVQRAPVTDGHAGDVFINHADNLVWIHNGVEFELVTTPVKFTSGTVLPSGFAFPEPPRVGHLYLWTHGYNSSLWIYEQVGAMSFTWRRIIDSQPNTDLLAGYSPQLYDPASTIPAGHVIKTPAGRYWMALEQIGPGQDWLTHREKWIELTVETAVNLALSRQYWTFDSGPDQAATTAALHALTPGGSPKNHQLALATDGWKEGWIYLYTVTVAPTPGAIRQAYPEQVGIYAAPVPGQADQFDMHIQVGTSSTADSTGYGTPPTPLPPAEHAHLTVGSRFWLTDTSILEAATQFEVVTAPTNAATETTLRVRRLGNTIVGGAPRMDKPIDDPQNLPDSLFRLVYLYTEPTAGSGSWAEWNGPGTGGTATASKGIKPLTEAEFYAAVTAGEVVAGDWVVITAMANWFQTPTLLRYNGIGHDPATGDYYDLIPVIPHKPGFFWAADATAMAQQAAGGRFDANDMILDMATKRLSMWNGTTLVPLGGLTP